MRTTINSDRDLPLIVGENIRRLRQQFKLSHQKLGKFVGADGGYLCKIEKGEKRRVNYLILRNIASTFGLSTDDLANEDAINKVSFTEQKDNVFQQMRKIVSECNATPREKIQLLKVIADICSYLFVERL